MRTAARHAGRVVLGGGRGEVAPARGWRLAGRRRRTGVHSVNRPVVDLDDGQRGPFGTRRAEVPAKQRSPLAVGDEQPRRGEAAAVVAAEAATRRRSSGDIGDRGCRRSAMRTSEPASAAGEVARVERLLHADRAGQRGMARDVAGRRRAGVGASARRRPGPPGRSRPSPSRPPGHGGPLRRRVTSSPSVRSTAARASRASATSSRASVAAARSTASPASRRARSPSPAKPRALGPDALARRSRP